MLRKPALVTLGLWSASALAQHASPNAATGTAEIEPAPIASVINNTGLVPANLLPLVAQYLAGEANKTQQAIIAALSQPGIDPGKLTDPEHYYSYGQSPPVYPSPEGTGDGLWANAYAQAKAMVAAMSNEEKNNITIPAKDNRQCAGFTGSVDRIGFPGICLNDGPSGVRAAENVSGFPAQISIGASWDRGLAYWRAYQMGKEFKAKGVNVALGPVVGPLGRIAKGGRNWEGFSNDPYLAGQLVDPAVRGLQQSVIACVKHFIGNEQETNRNPFLQGFLAPLGINLNNSVSSNIDDKTIHELYLFPFYDAVFAGVGSVMGSYQRVNNSYACQNSKILNGLLKTELGFQGFTLADWYGQHTGIASADAGLDMVMPSDLYWGNDQLATAVKNGSMNGTRLDDMATRILAAWHRFAPLTSPGIDLHNNTDARDAGSAQIAFQAAVDGHVLVKNVDGALPLKEPKSMSIFGYDAIGGINTSVPDASLYEVSLEGTLKFTNGADFTFLQALLSLASVAPAGTGIPEVAFNGTLKTGGGSGGITPTITFAPYDSLLRQAATDGTTLHTDFTSQTPMVADVTGPCLVLINAQSSEAADRTTLADEWSDTLVKNVADQCSNTIVVIHNAGIRLVDRWIDHANVTAVIFAHLPGQASGEALTEILYGRQSPSGRLPYTVAHNESDYGALLNPTLPTAQDPQYSQSNFSEGIYIDYRYFLKNDILPRYAFGYGLTYTTFSYSNLSMSLAPGMSHSPSPPDASDTTPPPEGGLASLYDILATATITVENNGSVAAAEVAQLYVNIPNSGVAKQLRGFDKKRIKPGESTSFSFPLRRRDLSIWDVEKQQWMLQSGEYKMMVGKSVLDILLTNSFSLA
ncbi:hypothetical protein AC579_5921 [Pseudocercospora musae]|uniref:beta-glucosidase n=1 Tax=Pseudocercospora musae TaxID=113226 RepID=A0A139IT53_9PEZI|nr:hypothetical protein AC579_5921 [Pseudocercospora musae]